MNWVGLVCGATGDETQGTVSRCNKKTVQVKKCYKFDATVTNFGVEFQLFPTVDNMISFIL